MNTHLRRVAIVAGLIVYSLVFAEHFLRNLAPQPLLPRYVQASGYGIRANVPGARYRHTTEEVDVEMRINGAGMRADREYSETKPAGTCRIGLFGDSFFMSYEVGIEDSLANQLEALAKPGGKHCEVLNFAVSGFGTAENIVQYQELGRKYDLDYAILEWHRTDPTDNLRSGLFRVEDGVLRRTSATYLPGVGTRVWLVQFAAYRWLIEHSHLYAAVRELAANAMKELLVALTDPFSHGRKEGESGGAEEDGDRPMPAAGASLDALLIEEFVDAAARDGVRTILLDVPAQRFNRAFRSAFDYLASSRTELEKKVRFCSPVTRFEQFEAQGLELYYRKGHLHFNPRGYRALAEVCAKCLDEL